jgi:hypothetical protein
MVDVSIKLIVLIKICLKKPSADIMYSRLVQFPFRVVLKNGTLYKYSSSVLRFSIQLRN